MLIEVKNVQDRRTLASILVEAGYTVKIVKIKDGKGTKTYVEATKEEEKR